MVFVEQFWNGAPGCAGPSGRWVGRAWAAALLFSVSSVHAHIELLEPASRYGRRENKSCPCGEGGSNRRCDVERDGSDPNRSENVTVLAAGSSITLRFREYVDHGGRFRVAFDPEGADHEDFNRFILLDVPDPDDQTTNVGERGLWELQVELPDVSCDNCTLQLIQAMHGNEEDPVADPGELSTYYTCADIVLQGGQPMESFLAEQRATEQGARLEDAGVLSDDGLLGSPEAREGGCSVTGTSGSTKASHWLAACALLAVAVSLLRRRRTLR